MHDFLKSYELIIVRGEKKSITVTLTNLELGCVRFEVLTVLAIQIIALCDTVLFGS